MGNILAAGIWARVAICNCNGNDEDEVSWISYGDYDYYCDDCVDDEVLYHLQYGSGRVVPFGTGKFFAS